MSDDKIVPIRTKYTPELVARLLELLRAGKAVYEAAAEVGIRVATIRTWQVNHPELKTAIDQAREDAIRARKRSRGGVPIPRSPEQVATIAEALELGMTRRHAAAKAGVGARAFDSWIEEDSQFELAVLNAEATCQEEALRRLKLDGNRRWTADAWLLERRFKDYQRQFEIPLAERQRSARRVGTDMANILVAALTNASLDPEAQERVRKELAAELEKATG